MDSPKANLLFLAANPIPTVHLAIDEEIRAITQKISAARCRDQMNLTSRWAVRREDLLTVLNETHPLIVHFSGHGSVTHEIILMDSSGGAQPVSAQALKELFKCFKNEVKLVVLNACFSEAQASAIVENVDFAIGMSDFVDDATSISFSTALYQALGSGRSVQEAFEQAKASLHIQDTNEAHVPRLLVKEGTDPSTRIFFHPIPTAPAVPLRPPLQDRTIDAIHHLIRDDKDALDQQVQTMSQNLEQIIGAGPPTECVNRMLGVLQRHAWPAAQAQALVQILRNASQGLTGTRKFQIQQLCADLEVSDQSDTPNAIAASNETGRKTVYQHAEHIVNIENQTQHGDWNFGSKS